MGSGITGQIKTVLTILGAIVLVLGAANAYLGVPLPGTDGPAFPTVSSGDDNPGSGQAAVGDPTITPSPTPTRDRPGTPYQLNQSLIERHIHDYVNMRRDDAGVRELMWDENLQAIARKHSQDMAANGYVGHEQPDGDTRADRYNQGGYDCSRETHEGVVTGGENVAKVHAFVNVEAPSGTVYADSEREVAELVVEVWMDSQGHRKNLLRDYWGRQGIGVWLVHSSDKTTVYVTQNFC